MSALVSQVSACDFNTPRLTNNKHYPVLEQCCGNVVDVGQTLAQHWMNTCVVAEISCNGSQQYRTGRLLLNKMYCSNVVLMLAQRLRRWLNIKITLVQYIAAARCRPWYSLISGFAPYVNTSGAGSLLGGA